MPVHEATTPLIFTVAVPVIIVGKAGKVVGQAVDTGSPDDNVILRWRGGHRRRDVFVKCRWVEARVPHQVHRSMPRRRASVRRRAMQWLGRGTWMLLDVSRRRKCNPICARQRWVGIDAWDRASARGRAGIGRKDLGIGATAS